MTSQPAEAPDRGEQTRLLQGEQALALAALAAGCRFYAAASPPYAETVHHVMRRRMAEYGGVFFPAQDEDEAIHALCGAAMAGRRAMAAVSSPGASLCQAGLSQLAALELPAVLANFSRGGPGMGNISPSQSDYFQATRGGGHGDYRTLTLSPCSGQELSDMTARAFALADKYRNPVVILSDAMLGQMVEPVALPSAAPPDANAAKSWALCGAAGRPRRVLASLNLSPSALEAHNHKLVRKYDVMRAVEPAWEEHLAKDAAMVVVAHGTAARIAKGAIKRVRRLGLSVGLLRPKTLWPFPAKALSALTEKTKLFLVFEMSTGQMVDDVRLALAGRGQVFFHGRPGGVAPTPEEVAHQISHFYFKAGLEAQPSGEEAR